MCKKSIYSAVFKYLVLKDSNRNIIILSIYLICIINNIQWLEILSRN